jgi:hypothetical protein
MLSNDTQFDKSDFSDLPEHVHQPLIGLKSLSRKAGKNTHNEYSLCRAVTG